MNLEVNSTIVSFVVGVLITNIGLIMGAYVSIVVRLAKLEVKADGFNKDLNNAWKFIKLRDLSDEINKEEKE